MFKSWQEVNDYWAANNIEPLTRIVVCAANRYGDLVIAGARHYDGIMDGVMDALSLESRKKVRECRQTGDYDQGFIDQFGIFMDRKEAKWVAEASGQRLRSEPGDILFSEDLY